MKALIDVEVIMHQELAKGERDNKTYDQILEQCVLKIWIWRGLAGNCEPVLCFSCPHGGNFRKVICPTYKAHRKEKPEHFERLKAELRTKFHSMHIKGLEADDVIGILQTSKEYGPTRIVSIDKDFKTIPGWLVNPDKLLEQHEITESQANYNWMLQTLIGDTADGFKGCPGIGEKKAEKALEQGADDCDWWPWVLGEFNKVNEKSEDYHSAVLQARLARILHREDYDKENRRIKLWHPDPEQVELFDLVNMEVAMGKAIHDRNAVKEMG